MIIVMAAMLTLNSVQAFMIPPSSSISFNPSFSRNLVVVASSTRDKEGSEEGVSPLPSPVVLLVRRPPGGGVVFNNPRETDLLL